MALADDNRSRWSVRPAPVRPLTERERYRELFGMDYDDRADRLLGGLLLFAAGSWILYGDKRART
jgi:hypothetical protein